MHLPRRGAPGEESGEDGFDFPRRCQAPKLLAVREGDGAALLGDDKTDRVGTFRESQGRRMTEPLEAERAGVRRERYGQVAAELDDLAPPR